MCCSSIRLNKMHSVHAVVWRVVWHHKCFIEISPWFCVLFWFETVKFRFHFSTTIAFCCCLLSFLLQTFISISWTKENIQTIFISVSCHDALITKTNKYTKLKFHSLSVFVNVSVQIVYRIVLESFMLMQRVSLVDEVGSTFNQHYWNCSSISLSRSLVSMRSCWLCRWWCYFR